MYHQQYTSNKKRKSLMNFVYCHVQIEVILLVIYKQVVMSLKVYKIQT